MAQKDKPWLFRTYAGHSTAEKSNALYRTNLAKGQTGLSVAFDLPTQTGYDSDHVLARGEVGKVGVPVCHLGDMRALFDQIPLEQMNTSMTINGTAMWLLALYVALARERGLATMLDFAGAVHDDRIRLAASTEFVESPAALPSFESAYGFRLPLSRIVSLPGGDTAVTARAAA